jgi:hypothetical protein
MLVVLGVSSAAETLATPLYGGYNGQSTSWVEYKIGNVETNLTSASIIFGSDSNDRSWVRMRVSLVPFFTRLEYTRDHLGIQSVALNTLFPWPVQLGSEIMETPGDIPLWWITSYLVLGTGGIDSEGNSWAETGIPGVYGMGSDSAGNQWLWFKVGDYLRGFGEDYAPVEPAGVPGDAIIPRTAQSLRSLRGRFDESLGKALAARLQSAEFMRAAAQCSYALHGAAYGSVTGALSAGGGLGMGDAAAGKNRACVQSCVPALSEQLTGDTGDGLGMLLEDFVREVRPLLREGLPSE